MKPLLVMPRLVGGLETKVGWLNVREPVLHDEPLVLRFGQLDETATPKPFVTMGLIAGTPQWWDPRGGPGDARGADSRSHQEGAPARHPCEKSLVSTTAQSLRHRSRIRRSKATQTDLRLAHSLM